MLSIKEYCEFILTAEVSHLERNYSEKALFRFHFKDAPEIFTNNGSRPLSLTFKIPRVWDVPEFQVSFAEMISMSEFDEESFEFEGNGLQFKYEKGDENVSAGKADYTFVSKTFSDPTDFDRDDVIYIFKLRFRGVDYYVYYNENGRKIDKVTLTPDGPCILGRKPDPS